MDANCNRELMDHLLMQITKGAIPKVFLWDSAKAASGIKDSRLKPL